MTALEDFIATRSMESQPCVRLQFDGRRVEMSTAAVYH
jgi:hypothetical protein